VVVTDNGKIYSWGLNINGELGISERNETVIRKFIKRPREVTGLSGKTIGNSFPFKAHF